jgi:gluconokinase
MGIPSHAVIVMGVSGCGKSTLATDLAARLACTAFDGDDFHSEASIAKMRSGQALNDDDRWPWLDLIGAAVGAAASDAGVTVAACSALKRTYRSRLERAAAVPLLFVLLDADRSAISEYMAARDSHYMPASLLDSQLALLERPGSDERALVLHSYAPVEDLSSAVLAWVPTQFSTGAL